MTADHRDNSVRPADAIYEHLPADRSAGLSRICVFLPIGGLLLVSAWPLFAKLDFTPSAIASMAEQLSWAFLTLCTAVAGLAFTFVGLHWLLYVLWPGPMGITVRRAEVLIALGPFGRRVLDRKRMTAQYRFELEDRELLSPEDFMTPEEEVETCLPILRHPEHPDSLNDIIRKYIAGPTEQHLRLLNPLIQSLRDSAPTVGDEKEASH
jgi:hypothetical protein